MNQIIQAFQPPLYWQQFEDLTTVVFPYIYHDNRPQKFGRPGQSQNGVDIIGRCHRRQCLVGIQCKRMDELDDNNQPYPGGIITANLLREEYAKASQFAPQLGEWILATTAKRDANIQREAFKLSEESCSNGGFEVRVWFWDDYVSDLNRFHDLQKSYYTSVLKLRDRMMKIELYLSYSDTRFLDLHLKTHFTTKILTIFCKPSQTRNAP